MPATLLKKRLWNRCFQHEFCKMFIKTFFIEHLWWLLLFSHLWNLKHLFWKNWGKVFSRNLSALSPKKASFRVVYSIKYPSINSLEICKNHVKAITEIITKIYNFLNFTSKYWILRMFNFTFREPLTLRSLFFL